MAKTMSIPNTISFEQIAMKAAEKVKAGRRIRTAFITAGSKQGIDVLAQAVEAGLIEPILIGPKKSANEAHRQSALSSAETVSTNDAVSSVTAAIQLAKQHRVDLMFADEHVTDTAIDEIGKADSGFVAKGAVASSVAVLKPQKYPKLLLLSDCAVCSSPDLKTKLGIIQNIVEVARSLEIENPRIAVLAAVEVVYPQMPVTIDGAVLAKMAERKQIKGALVDGPLSFDVAIDEFAATSKGITQSPVAGQADAFLAPNVEVAAGVYSALSLFGVCVRGAVIVGGAVPAVVTMRTDSGPELLNSLHLGILSA